MDSATGKGTAGSLSLAAGEGEEEEEEEEEGQLPSPPPPWSQVAMSSAAGAEEPPGAAEVAAPEGASKWPSGVLSSLSQFSLAPMFPFSCEWSWGCRRERREKRRGAVDEQGPWGKSTAPT